MAHNSSDGHVGCIVWPQTVGYRKNPGTPPQCLMCPEVAISQRIHLCRQKLFQSALRKFQLFTGSLWVVTLSFGGFVWEGRCCDLANFPRTCLSGSRLSWPKLTKARSGSVPTFHRWEKKLAVSFGLCNSPRSFDVAQESRLSPSQDVLL